MKLRSGKTVLGPTEPVNWVSLGNDQRKKELLEMCNRLPGYNWVKLDNIRRKEELLKLCKNLPNKIKYILERRDAEIMPIYLELEEEWTDENMQRVQDKYTSALDELMLQHTQNIRNINDRYDVYNLID